jgi:hypothetical protein
MRDSCETEQSVPVRVASDATLDGRDEGCDERGRQGRDVAISAEPEGAAL